MCSAISRRVAVSIWAFVCATASPAQADGVHTRVPGDGVASASLCADAYLLELAGPGRIAALSWQAGDPISQAPGWARDLPRAWPDAERIYALAPAMTVFGAGEGGRTARLLDRAGLHRFELAWADDFDGVRANLRALGEALGEPERAAAAISSLDTRLAALDARARQRGLRPHVLYLSASGGTAGAHTCVDAAIAAAGGTNAMAQAGVSGWPRARPEAVLGVQADLLVTSFFTDGYASTFNRGRHHAAYRHVLDATPRIEIPAGDWPCAGPRLIEAAERIADALDALAQGEAP